MTEAELMKQIEMAKEEISKWEDWEQEAARIQVKKSGGHDSEESPADSRSDLKCVNG